MATVNPDPSVEVNERVSNMPNKMAQLIIDFRSKMTQTQLSEAYVYLRHVTS